MRQAFAGMLWSKQLYDYDVRALAGRRPDPAAAAGGSADGAQLPLDELRRLRHHVDARQVGVPVVRRLGPRLPLRRPGPPRPGVRQVPAAAAVPGVVPAPERRAARLRVGLRRRQPAGAGVGGARGVRHRRRPRPRLPQPRLRQAARQLHVVGEPRGRRRHQPVRGRLPRPRQHRPARPLAPARSAARSSSPTPPAGWRSTRWRWPASPTILNRAGPAAGDRPRAQVPRALRRRSARRWTRSACGTTTTASTTTSWSRPTAPSCRSRSARWSGSSRCWPRSSLDEDIARPGRDAGQGRSPACSSDLGGREGLVDQGLAAGRARRASACCSASSASTTCVRLFEQAVRRATSSCRRTACGPCRPTTATTPTSSTSRACTATIDYEPAESTTAMFGGNSNWRGPIWFPLNYLVDQRPRALRPLLRRRADHRVPDRQRAATLTLDEIADDLRRRLIAPLPRGARTAGGRASGGVERLQRDPAWQDNLVFNEYFHGDNGAGLGASHQTGWTGLVADLIRGRPGNGVYTLGERAAARRGAGLRVTRGRRPASLHVRPGRRCAARRDTARRAGHQLRRRVERRRRDRPVPVRRRGRRDAGAVEDYDAGVWHGFVDGVGPGQAYGFRALGPYDPREGDPLQPGQAAARSLRPGDDRCGDVRSRGPRPRRRTSRTCPARSTRLATCPEPGRRSGRSPGPTPATAPTATPTRSSTRCTSRASRCATRTCRPRSRARTPGSAHEAAIAHLVDLGVTAVELLPVHQNVPEAFLVQRGLTNYWGYNTIGFFAPHDGYSAAVRAGRPGGQVAEFKAMVDALHGAGLEVHPRRGLQPHGRGRPHRARRSATAALDNPAYYRLDPDGPPAATSTRPAAATR